MKYRITSLSILLALSFQVSSQVKEFKEPRVEGLRMDRCLTWGNECDEPAAYKWCLEKGFSKAIYWEIDNNIGQKQPTKMLKSKEICNKPDCDGMKLIVCYKNE